MRKSKRRPGNVVARDLLGNEIFPEVVSGVGTIKEGALVKG